MPNTTAHAKRRSCGQRSYWFLVNDLAFMVNDSGEYGSRKFQKKLDDGTLVDVAIYDVHA